jgi:hypothetical protein
VAAGAEQAKAALRARRCGILQLCGAEKRFALPGGMPQFVASAKEG